MSRTPEDLWSNNRSIKNIEQLKADLDSMDMEYNKGLYYHYINTGSAYSFFAKDRKIKIPDEVVRKKAIADSIQNLKMQEEYLSQQDSLMLAESNVGGGPDNVRATAPADPQQGPAEVVVPPPTVAEKDAVAQTDPVDTAPVQPTVSPVQTSVPKEVVNPVPPLNPEEKARLDSIINVPGFQSRAASIGLNTARTLKNNFSTNFLNLDNLDRESRRWEIAWYQKYTQAIACIVMFMIGAPLGAIIKKGGLGVPVLFSIIFFILYYMLTITGDKWAKEGVTGTLFGTWFSVLALLPFGLFFLRQARRDARLFEADFYYGLFVQVRGIFKKGEHKN